MVSLQWRWGTVYLQVLVSVELLLTCLGVTEDSGLELWLEDYTRVKNSNNDIQSDSPRGLDEELFEYECPMVPPEKTTASVIHCLLPKCETDLDCDWPVQKCCHNGCIQTCMDGVSPSTYVDWRRQPHRDPHTGISWLIPDDNGDDDGLPEDIDTDKELQRQVARSNLADRCYINDEMYADGTNFIHRTYPCKCQKGLIYCNVDTRKK